MMCHMVLERDKSIDPNYIIGMLYNPYKAGIDFRRQNLTSDSDV